MNEQLVSLNGRIDHVLTGFFGATTRENAERIDALEKRVERIERRTG